MPSDAWVQSLPAGAGTHPTLGRPLHMVTLRDDHATRRGAPQSFGALTGLGRGPTIGGMKRPTLLLIVAACVLAAGGCRQNMGLLLRPVALTDALEETVIDTDRGLFVSDKIAVVDVDGLLFNRRDGGMFGSGENPVSLFVEKLDKAAGDSNVKAVVLRINSPGGGVTASDIMHRRLKTFRDEKKVPVVAVIEDVGASGAYYLASAADTILAHPTSVTGSIGVIVQTVSLAGTMEKLGIDAHAVTSGPYKDMGSPLKPLDEADRKIIRAMVDEFYNRFVDTVAAGRQALARDKVAALADGRVYTGRQALDLGLVDGLADVEEAIDLAKKKCGSKAAKVVMYHRGFGYRANAYSTAPLAAPQINLLNISVPHLMDLTRPQFLYLWTGRSFGSEPP